MGRVEGTIDPPVDAADRRQDFCLVPKTPPSDQLIVQTEEGLSLRTNEAEKKAEIILDFLKRHFPEEPQGDTFWEAENFQRPFYGWWQSHATMKMDPYGTNAIIATITHEDLENVAFDKFREARIKRCELAGSENRQEHYQTEGEVFYWKRVLTVLEAIRLQDEPGFQKPQKQNQKEPVSLHK